ncbi:MAG: phage head closure protein [Filomicrobium sp.]
MTDTDDIKIGNLRQRIAIEEPVRTSDGGGGAEETWGLVAEVWAQIRPLNGSERAEADGLAGKVTHEIILRYRSGLRPDMRFVYQGRVFDIRAVLDLEERRRFLRCFVEEWDL